MVVRLYTIMADTEYISQFADMSLDHTSGSRIDTLPIQLREYQVPCVNNVLDVWEDGRPAIISSQTGSGKTYMGSMAAYLYGAQYVFVLGPKSSLSKWRNVLSLVFPPSSIYCGTYEGWKYCGTLEVPSPKQPYTTRIHREREGGGIGYDFESSDIWNELVWNYRCVFILDEFHKLQKPSQRTYATAANTRPIILYECPSRILALSYTPCDNLSDIPMHLYLLGMTNGTHLAEYNKRTKTYDTRGLQGVYDIAASFEKVSIEDKNNVTNAKYLKGRLTHNRVNAIAGQLFLRYIRKYIVFFCNPDFVTDETLIPVYNNYFCKVSKHASDTIMTIIAGGVGEEKAIENFMHIVEDTSNMAALTSIQQALEKVKRPLYLELAKEWLEKHPNGKVAIMVLYLDTMDELCDALIKYNPVRIEGCMNGDARDVSINTFQAHNLDSRVIIATLTTGGESIDLHDTSPDGNYPRLLLIPPCFYTKPTIQASGRVFRDSVTSKPTIKIVYTATLAGNKYVEHRFYESVRRKSDVVKQYHAEGQNSKLPCDYQDIISKKVYRTSVD